MDTGEFLTRSSVWISIVGYVVGSVILAASSASPRRVGSESYARLAWTIACASLIAHFVSAFHFYHGWSHAAAYEDTARQTRELFGLDWGGGVFVNYALLVAWMIDIGWWWRGGVSSYRKRPWLLVVLWHGFLVFIIFNATVVFAEGVVRWIGLVICLILIVAWFRIVRLMRSRQQNGPGGDLVK